MIIFHRNIVMNFLTNSLKSLSGVLKPHFIQMCMMNLTIVDQLRYSHNGPSRDNTVPLGQLTNHPTIL